MKISFCTTCMGRAHHVKQTYPASIRNTEGCDREFVLVNYNSPDDLDKWVRGNLMEHIESGVVAYYKTTDPACYISTHAKNVAHKLGTGDILCNLDADNTVLPGFYEHLLGHFAAGRVIVCCAHPTSGGCVTMRREDFYSVGGYDEDQCEGWGCCDCSLSTRASVLNRVPIVTFDRRFESIIDHTDEERVRYFKNKDKAQTGGLAWRILDAKLAAGRYVANEGRTWGSAVLVKNFTEEVVI